MVDLVGSLKNMADTKNRSVFAILFLIAAFFVLLMIFASYTLELIGSGELGRKQTGRGQIGVITIEGVILESRPIIELLHQAEKEKNIQAILLRINSPGGAVAPTQEIFEEVRRIDSAWGGGDDSDGPSKESKKSDGKPVFASLGAVAASGGYYIGSAARKIFANPGTLTGSIGVIMQYMDLSELFHMAKIQQNTIKSGRFKDLGSPSRPMTMEESDLMKEVVKGVHQQFIEDILSTRKSGLKKSIHEIAQGQVFSGADALTYGLVDDLAGLWGAGRKIHEELNLSGDFGLRFLESRRRPNFIEFLDTIEGLLSLVRMKLIGDNTPNMMFMN